MKRSRGLRQSRSTYHNQEDIERKIFEHLLETQFHHPFVQTVYLLGSLVDGDFGVYHEPEHKHPGRPKYASDVDLLVIGDDRFSVPVGWRKVEPFIFDLYVLPLLEGVEGMQDNIHEVSALVYLPSCAQQPPARKKGLEGDIFDLPTREQCLAYQLQHSPHKLWYQKF